MYLFKIQKKRLWEQGIGFVEEYRTEEKTILKKKLQYKLNLSEINDKIKNRRINQKAGGTKKYFRLFYSIDSGAKISAFKFMPADCTKKYCKFHCANIPISL